jgi:uncharacterized membrane protein
MQYLDDVEDFLYAVALAAWRIRRAAKTFAVVAVSIALLGATVLLALTQPPLALAVVALLFVTMLYRAATTQPARTVGTR